ncbi:hypothetical protein ACFWF7_16640 [Nocardia sp. NPDC060256]|uniref:hypothetical protein n=1 Tax=unclassified Nocardia TaxID=2637762 RepID=UPI00364BA914
MLIFFLKLAGFAFLDSLNVQITELTEQLSAAEQSPPDLAAGNFLCQLRFHTAQKRQP